EPAPQICSRAPVRWVIRELAHDDARDLRRGRLGIIVVDAVVADERRGHDHDLPTVRRIREYFLVAGHVRGEHDFGHRGLALRASGSVKKGSVLEEEEPCLIARLAHGVRAWAWVQSVCWRSCLAQGPA